jgi:hypothetical protein
MLLVFVLTFEGLARKLQIPGANIPIFFLKDVIVLILGFHILRISRPREIDFLWGAYMLLCALFLPLIIWTALHDPLLAIFGAKEYLLYPIVGFAFYLAFHDLTADEIVRFFRWTSLLIIPTGIIALVQLRLPPTHWLNLSVEGDSLAAFSAAGKLRVSSTFSFVAQFCAFLNAELLMLAIALSRADNMKFFIKWLYLSTVPILVISNYITGSRGAVVGSTTIIILSFALSMLKLDIRNALRLFGAALALFTIVMAGQHFLPDEFAAYSMRENGQLVGYSNEIQTRMTNSFFNWVGSILETPVMGYGLGIMTNGSELFSDYAATYRDYGKWTETDFATTLFEGGIYLVVIWYGFRYYIIYQTTHRFLADVRGEIALPACFAQAFVIIFLVTATLSLQPPIAIWCWMGIGTSLALWWKCIEPKRDDTGVPIEAPPPKEKKMRGRSAYADRLHGD